MISVYNTGRKFTLENLVEYEPITVEQVVPLVRILFPTKPEKKVFTKREILFIQLHLPYINRLSLTRTFFTEQEWANVMEEIYERFHKAKDLRSRYENLRANLRYTQSRVGPSVNFITSMFNFYFRYYYRTLTYDCAARAKERFSENIYNSVSKTLSYSDFPNEIINPPNSYDPL